jgi:hypothetical protein
MVFYMFFLLRPTFQLSVERKFFVICVICFAVLGWPKAEVCFAKQINWQKFVETLDRNHHTSDKTNNVPIKWKKN